MRRGVAFHRVTSDSVGATFFSGFRREIYCKQEGVFVFETSKEHRIYRRVDIDQIWWADSIDLALEDF